MGCCGDREKLVDVRAEQKWDYINLSDFKSSSCFTELSYGILYIFLLTSIAVYGVDTFTAVNLLVFDRWSGQVQPFIPFAISKWIFAACIILSWIFLVYRWLRALRAMKSGSVAASYLDPLAVRVQSIRMGKTGRGWRRFLVFAELTKSKKGAEYVALFTYFSFEAWMRIIFAEGPRQVINALTLYSVMQLNLIPAGERAANDGRSSAAQFFVNVGVLAESNKQQAVILFSMLFTLVIWVISALSLLIAALMYIVFLWHHIPTRDRGLSGYCRRKIDSRLSKIVGIKVKKALEKEDSICRRGDSRTNSAGSGRPSFKRQPTIPDLQTSPEDTLPHMPMLSRQTTQTSLPQYLTRPSTPESNPVPGLSRQPTLPSLPLGDDRPFPPSRTGTQSSATSHVSYGSNAPLLNRMGSTDTVSRQLTISPAPLLSNQIGAYGDVQRPHLEGYMTGGSHNTQRSYSPLSRPPPSQARRMPSNGGPPLHHNTGWSAYDSAGASPISSHSGSQGRRTPGPYITASNFNETNRSNSSSKTPRKPTPLHESRSQTPASGITRLPTNGSYVAFNPAIHSTPVNQSNNPSPIEPSIRLPHRNFTAPNQHVSNHPITQPYPPQRSGTAPLPQATTTYDDSIYDSYYRPDEDFERPPMPSRAATWDHQGNIEPGRYQQSRF